MCNHRDSDTIDNVKESVVALIDHRSEINLMSKELYRKGKWPITMDHGWKIHVAIKATEDLFASCLNVPVKTGDVEINQNFFVQEEISHPVVVLYNTGYVRECRWEP